MEFLKLLEVEKITDGLGISRTGVYSKKKTLLKYCEQIIKVLNYAGYDVKILKRKE